MKKHFLFQTPSPLTPHPSPYALGLISGTSADGVSAAIIKIINESIRLISYKTYPYPFELRKKVLSAINLKTPEISRLNFELGEFFAKAAVDLMRQSKIKNLKSKISAIGSHGQTIYHGPQDRPANTLQIGEPAVIAQRTGLTVVANFRPQDMAAGGEGAPLVPFFDWYCFRQNAPAILLNIGGIANLTLVTKKAERVIAFDTGPGNCLMDLAVSLVTGEPYAFDRDGRIAARGTIDEKAVRKALTHPYFRCRPPKSTGRELFNAEFLKHYFIHPSPLTPHPSPSLLATLAAFTAESISQAVYRFVLPSIVPPLTPHPSPLTLPRCLLSGGGAKNPFLVRLLREKLFPIAIATTDQCGIPAQAKEAMAFALMAHQAIRGLSNHLPQTTGAKGPPKILGQIII